MIGDIMHVHSSMRCDLQGCQENNVTVTVCLLCQITSMRKRENKDLTILVQLFTLEYRIKGGENNGGGGVGEIENSLFLRQTRISYIFM